MAANNDDMVNAIAFVPSGFSTLSGQYNTNIGTPDGLNTSCTSAAPKNNVWFKFVALETDQSLFVLTGGTFGTLQKPIMSVWDETGNIEIACYQGTTIDKAFIHIDNLIVGNTYLVSIDNTNTNEAGSFTLFADASEISMLDVLAPGTIKYNDSLNKFQGWNGTNWVDFN